MSTARLVRVLVAFCPRWPVAALGYSDEEPVAVIEDHRVVAASASAAELGVATGQRKREAEHCCPGLAVVGRDRAVEARAFEPVAAAVATLTPLVEVTEPGSLALDVRGPARYLGGEEALCREVAAVARSALPERYRRALRVGIADGRFTATLAARHGLLVPRGEAAIFLAPHGVEVLGDPDLAGLLVRLGLPTLGAFAALPTDAVARRFGPAGELAHRRSRGLDVEHLDAQAPAEELSVRTEFDPPAERVDVAAFAGRSLADELAVALGERFLACTRLVIEAETEHGERLSRRWRADDRFSIPTIVERLRWQLEGWLSGTAPEPVPTAGISWLRLVADEVVPASGRQLQLFGGRSDADERAMRGLDRLRGMLGPDAVFTAVVRGGRGPAERVVLVPWGEPVPELPAGPFPGRDPAPAPAIVYREPVPAELVDADGQPVRVLSRGRISGDPALVAIRGGPWVGLAGWAGPWLVDERTWDPRARRRRARFQLLTADQDAHLAYTESGRWWIEATYD